MLSRLVDVLPSGLWKPGNLRVGGRLHFCVGSDPRGQTVRTVEWNSREVAHGRRRRTLPDV